MKLASFFLVSAFGLFASIEAEGGPFFRWLDEEGVTVISTEPPILTQGRIDKKLIRSHVQRAAASVKIDAPLIEAIITHESGWRIRAVSNKGAMGLMQLMPNTARNWGVTDPFDPLQNITGGARYLKYLLGLFEEDLSLALAAYHAGEDRVLKMRAIPPFVSTRNYVLSVMKTYSSLKN
jgi:soluble lytic murein transglycosylase-like protein